LPLHFTGNGGVPLPIARLTNRSESAERR
jgi:hypothetical protein